MHAVIGHDFELTLMLHHFESYGTDHLFDIFGDHSHAVSILFGIVEKIVISYDLVGIVEQLVLHPPVSLAGKATCLYCCVQLLLFLLQPTAFERQGGMADKACGLIERGCRLKGGSVLTGQA